MNERAMSELASAVADAIYRDAERYRWLRENSGLVAGMFGGIATTHGVKTKEDKRLLDERIDALRALPPPEERQG